MKITRKSFIWGFSAAVLVSAVMVLPCLAEDQARSTSGFSVEPVEYVVFIGFDGLSAWARSHLRQGARMDISIRSETTCERLRGSWTTLWSRGLTFKAYSSPTTTAS